MGNSGSSNTTSSLSINLKKLSNYLSTKNNDQQQKPPKHEKHICNMSCIPSHISQLRIQKPYPTDYTLFHSRMVEYILLSTLDLNIIAIIHSYLYQPYIGCTFIEQNHLQYKYEPIYHKCHRHPFFKSFLCKNRRRFHQPFHTQRYNYHIIGHRNIGKSSFIQQIIDQIRREFATNDGMQEWRKQRIEELRIGSEIEIRKEEEMIRPLQVYYMDDENECTIIANYIHCSSVTHNIYLNIYLHDTDDEVEVIDDSLILLCFNVMSKFSLYKALQILSEMNLCSNGLIFIGLKCDLRSNFHDINDSTYDTQMDIEWEYNNINGDVSLSGAVAPYEIMSIALKLNVPYFEFSNVRNLREDEMRISHFVQHMVQESWIQMECQILDYKYIAEEMMNDSYIQQFFSK